VPCHQALARLPRGDRAVGRLADLGILKISSEFRAFFAIQRIRILTKNSRKLQMPRRRIAISCDPNLHWTSHMRERVFVFMAAVVLGAASISAHDFWLGAAPWTPSSGALTITANVGERFPKGTSYTAPERVDQWRVVGASGEVAVSRTFRREGDALAADARLPSPGAYLGVMTIAARSIDMQGDEFTKYLKEEGLESIIANRAAAGETDKATKERYARYAKIAVRDGAGGAAHLTRPVGLKAEFVPTTDPTIVHPGGALTTQLLADGKPVVNAAVTAVAADGTAQKATTDRDGRVTFKIDRAGAWLIKTVHMVRLPAGSPEGEWESFWVTLAFHTAAH
jgi:hypothetical protein